MNTAIHTSEPDAPPRRDRYGRDYTRKRLLTRQVLLEESEKISDGLETELYARTELS